MEQKYIVYESEIQINRPKIRKICLDVKKSGKTSLASSTSTENSETDMNKNKSEEIKPNFEKVTLDEINSDFCSLITNLEAEELRNEINDILSKEYKEEENETKIERCHNPLKMNIEKMNDSYFDDMIEELNQNESIKEKDERILLETKL